MRKSLTAVRAAKRTARLNTLKAARLEAKLEALVAEAIANPKPPARTFIGPPKPIESYEVSTYQWSGQPYVIVDLPPRKTEAEIKQSQDAFWAAAYAWQGSAKCKEMEARELLQNEKVIKLQKRRMAMSGGQNRIKP